MEHHVGILLQARTTSTRLPGKVLKPILGLPMVIRQMERLARAQSVHSFVLVTSTDPSDDELVMTVKDQGWQVFRGSLDNVLERYVTAAERYQLDTIVRVTGDCPLISPSILDQCVNLHLCEMADYTSNAHPPTFPDGLDVEVLSRDTLLRAGSIAKHPAELEHVTWGVWNRPHDFKIRNLEATVDLSELRWTVDTAEDFDFVSWVYDKLFLEKPDFDFEDIVSLIKIHPELSRTDALAPRNSAVAGLTLEDL